MLPRVAPFAANVADGTETVGTLPALAELDFAPNSNAKAASVTTTPENKSVRVASLSLVRNIEIDPSQCKNVGFNTRKSEL
jgi:hypothetical protein